MGVGMKFSYYDSDISDWISNEISELVSLCSFRDLFHHWCIHFARWLCWLSNVRMMIQYWDQTWSKWWLRFLKYSYLLWSGKQPLLGIVKCLVALCREDKSWDWSQNTKWSTFLTFMYIIVMLFEVNLLHLTHSGHCLLYHSLQCSLLFLFV